MSPSSERERLLLLIENAKFLPVYPDVNWNEHVWDVTQYEKTKGHKNRAFRLKFLQRHSSRVALDKRIPFKSDFAEWCKCMIKMKQMKSNITFNQHQVKLNSMGILHDILSINDANCDPTLLNKKNFKAVEEVLIKDFEQTTAYRMSKTLEEVSDFLDHHRLTRVKIRYKSQIKRPKSGDLRSKEGQKRGWSKIPSEEIFEALAEISNNTIDKNELILIRIVDLLVVGGFRIGEVLSLPVKCWVSKPQFSDSGKPLIDEDTGNQIVSCGIRYWPEKGHEPSIKWIPSHAVPLAKRAIEDLIKECGKARGRARILERNTNRVPFSAQKSSKDLITTNEVQKIVGCRCGGDFVRQLGLKPAKVESFEKGKRYLYRVGEIETALFERLRPLVVLERDNGKKQVLSESLCVCYFYQFKSSSTNKLIAQPINEQHISDLLGGRKTVKSAFSRRGMKASDGSAFHVNTHAFRHWLNTLADNGGLNELQLARWMGRKDVRNNEAYKHGTVAQRVEMSKKLIKDGGLAGPIADVYEGLDPVERELFLEAHVNTAHFTPYGLCLHDYSIEPCEYHLKCLDGCLEYLRIKGNQQERKELKKLQVVLEIQIAKYRDASGQFVESENPFLNHSLRQLDGVKAALDVDADSDTSIDKVIISVFPKAGEKDKSGEGDKDGAWQKTA
ncbi:hypothetical protein [Desulfovibrio gilichinskyi]|uniref:Phage integrase family protein n=1 Tax=Desulfovibrio gilichinskyi TaxID=1519643 RepID=A0A1X7DST2_9BACT|nr:hypothetical protein [Desulfovibrio gilichinskyi]SMF20790.1 hypothetical protein SAMN06295933_2295 [Desulfovibrio gilichinskyi]